MVDVKCQPTYTLEFLCIIIKALGEVYGLVLSEEDRFEIDKMRHSVLGEEVLIICFDTYSAHDDIKNIFVKTYSQLIDIVNSKLDLHNKLTEVRDNGMFKNIFFGELYE